MILNYMPIVYEGQRSKVKVKGHMTCRKLTIFREPVESLICIVESSNKNQHVDHWVLFHRGPVRFELRLLVFPLWADMCVRGQNASPKITFLLMISYIILKHHFSQLNCALSAHWTSTSLHFTYLWEKIISPVSLFEWPFSLLLNCK